MTRELKGDNLKGGGQAGSNGGKTGVVGKGLAALTSLKMRILYLCLVPALVAVALAAEVGLERLARLADSERTVAQVGLVPDLANLIQGVAVERGNTARYIGARGQNFDTELSRARDNTDQRVKTLLGNLEGLPLAARTAEFEQRMKEVRRGLDELAEVRASVDQTLSAQAGASYTGLIGAVIWAMELSGEDIDDHGLSTLAKAHLALVEAMEQSGLERAAGVRFLNDPGQRTLLPLVGFRARQVTFEAQISTFGDEKMTADWRGVTGSREFDRVTALREVISALAFDPGAGTVTTTEWFEAATARLELMKSVETDVAQRLLNVSSGIAERQGSELWRELMFVLGALFLSIILVVVISRSILRPINRLTTTMTEMASGRFDIDIAGTAGRDELGQMARAVEIFKINGLERVRLESKSEGAQKAAASRQSKVEGLIGEFRQAATAALKTVSDNSEQMNQTATSLTEVAKSTTGQANAAAGASQEASQNVQAVAAAAEELATSIEEISRQVSKTNNIVNEATVATRTTNDKVTSLANAAKKIGDVIELIQDIAEQTNLLALNTSIEAARAGEMGKGFAVVATEVKSLASQTASATEEISSQIADIQASTTDVVGAIEEIATTMAEVNSYTASIASAVEQQGAATAEISQSVAQAAAGTQTVAGSIEEVTASVSETTQSAAQVHMAAGDVARQAQSLRKTVDTFLDEVAAA
ncbi:MAG: methyl-accepting chemotaxis protein [Alphaproteobacteria bacterium]|nr:methyl-accepting chemotaxis protein [Alphaproteobacteria bacterium]